MLNFHGQRTRTGCIVTVGKTDGGLFSTLPLYLDFVNHSPTGFEWGYYGSGPSQLAYAILHHYFVKGKGLTGKRAHEKAVDLYMEFKRNVVGSLPHDTWDMNEKEIDTYLEFVSEQRA